MILHIKELQKAIVSLPITADLKHTHLDKEQVKKKELLHAISPPQNKKIKAENFLTENVRHFSNKNKKEPEIAPTKFQMTSVANPRPFLAGEGPARPNKNANQLNLRSHGNQLNNVCPLRPTQAQAAQPSFGTNFDTDATVH